MKIIFITTATTATTTTVVVVAAASTTGDRKRRVRHSLWFHRGLNNNNRSIRYGIPPRRRRLHRAICNSSSSTKRRPRHLPQHTTLRAFPPMFEPSPAIRVDERLVQSITSVEGPVARPVNEKRSKTKSARIDLRSSSCWKGWAVNVNLSVWCKLGMLCFEISACLHFMPAYVPDIQAAIRELLVIWTFPTHVLIATMYVFICDLCVFVWFCIKRKYIYIKMSSLRVGRGQIFG